MAAGFCVSYGNELVGICFKWNNNVDDSTANVKYANNKSCIGKSCKKFKNRIVNVWMIKCVDVRIVERIILSQAVEYE